MFVTNIPGYGGDCYTGWETAYTGWNMEVSRLPRLLECQVSSLHCSCSQVEEIPATQVFGVTARAAPEFRTNGVIPNRRLEFTKLKDWTRLRLWYYDNMRAGAGMCQWNLLIDGNQCPSGPIGANVYRWGYGELPPF